MKRLVCLLAVTFAAMGSGLVTWAEELPDRLTLDWIYSDEGKAAGATPSYRFVGDRLLRYDNQLPKAERTLEFLDIASGRVLQRVDSAAALSSLDALLGTDESDSEEADGDDADEQEIGLPSAITADGRLGLYSKEGDLFVLDFAKSTYRRVTDSEGAKKSPRFSPDGSHIAFVRDNDLYVVDLTDDAEMAERRLTESGTDTILNGTLSWVYWEELFGRRDRGYLFSPDSKRIAFLQFDDSVVDVMTFLDPAPDATRVVRQRYPKAGTVNPKVRAGIIEIASGETTWVDLGRNPYEYLVRMAWLPRGDRLMVQALDRPQQNLDLFLVDAATGSAQHLFRESDEAWIDVHDDLIFLRNGTQFLWVSDRAGQPHIYLYKLTDDGAELVRPVTSGAWPVTRSASRADGLRGAIAAVDEKDGWVYFMGRKDSHLEPHLYRVDLEGKRLTRVTSQEGSHATTWSADGKFFVDAHSSLTRPSSRDLRHADGKAVRTLIEPSHRLAKHFKFGMTESLTVKADDGFELPATLIKPPGFDPKKRYPVIMNVYGGPAAPRVRNSWNGSLYTHLLSAEGFVIFTMDPRTSTARGKTTTRAVLRDFYGEREATDLIAGAKWLKTLKYVDPDRIGVTGWSGGGTTTVSVMTRSEEFRAGIAGAGVYDWHLYDTIYTERFMKHPDDNAEGYERNGLVDRVDKLHGRLMLLHGTYDDNVHPQNTLRLVDKLIELGTVFDLGIYPMRKHGFGDDDARLHRDKTRLEFWKRELGGPESRSRK